MKTILAATDFSAVAGNAVHYAAGLAAFEKAKLIIANVYAIPVPVSSDVPIVSIPYEELEAQSIAELKALERKINAKFPALQTEIVSKAGFVTDELLKIQQEKHSELTVMGITGAGRAAAVFGSNATTMQKISDTPIMVIPAHAAFKVPEKIALACDFKSVIPDQVVNKFKEFVKSFKCKVAVFDVLKASELVSYTKAASEVNLENSLGNMEHSVFFPSGEDPVAETNDFIDRNNIEMLVMIPHNYSYISKLFHRSITKKMALHSHVPLLSIHE